VLCSVVSVYCSDFQGSQWGLTAMMRMSVTSCNTTLRYSTIQYSTVVSCTVALYRAQNGPVGPYCDDEDVGDFLHHCTKVQKYCTVQYNTAVVSCTTYSDDEDVGNFLHHFDGRRGVNSMPKRMSMTTSVTEATDTPSTVMYVASLPVRTCSTSNSNSNSNSLVLMASMHVRRQLARAHLPQPPPATVTVAVTVLYSIYASTMPACPCAPGTPPPGDPGDPRPLGLHGMAQCPRDRFCKSTSDFKEIVNDPSAQSPLTRSTILHCTTT